MDLVHHPLAEQWRREAELLRRCAANEAATTREDCAAQLEAYERARSLEALTLTDASAESGYSKDHLALLVAKGAIENAGQKHAPRIRRRDLPRKPKRPVPKLPSGEPDLHAMVTAAKEALP